MQSMFAQWGDGLTVMPDPTLNRRQLLSASVLIGSSVALEAQARSISGEVPWQPGQANKPDAVEGGAPGDDSSAARLPNRIARSATGTTKATINTIRDFNSRSPIHASSD